MTPAHSEKTPPASRRPKLAVWKFASCDGCQLSLLDCEDELLAVAGAVDIANFAEASRDMRAGPYDVSLVEGSITTPHDAERIREVRAQSRVLITIGACATAGGIQALRNFQDVDEFIKIVYARPEFIDTLKHSTPIADHVKVDFELSGCPINKYQLLEVINAFLNKRRPVIPDYSVCVECKLRGNICVMTAQDHTPCMGPVTRAGCDAICPAYHRGCYGCFGPLPGPTPPNTKSLSDWWQQSLDVRQADALNAFRGFTTHAPEFRQAAEALGGAPSNAPDSDAERPEKSS